MNRILIAAFGVALPLASVSATDANGAFFINAGVGQGQYHVGRTDYPGFRLDDKDTAGALRFGYAWRTGSNFRFGVEGGYVDLGKSTQHVDTSYLVARSDFGITSWMLGINGTYRFAGKWYVSARCGWLRSRDEVSTRVYLADYDVGSHLKGDANGDGWYGGVGVGYDFASNFSMGLNYDNYHDTAKVFESSPNHNVGTYMVTAEYRF